MLFCILYHIYRLHGAYDLETSIVLRDGKASFDTLLVMLLDNLE